MTGLNASQSDSVAEGASLGFQVPQKCAGYGTSRDPDSAMGTVPIRDSVPRYHNQAFPEDATILAPPVLGSPTILQIVAAGGHRGMHACRGQFRIDQSSQSEMSRLKFISD